VGIFLLLLLLLLLLITGAAAFMTTIRAAILNEIALTGVDIEATSLTHLVEVVLL
jgi:hypothetical protein